MRAFVAALALLAMPAAAQQPHIGPALWFAQHVCVDARGQPVAGMIPRIDPLCSASVPARCEELLTFQRFDWRQGVRGPQRSDACLARDEQGWHVRMGFDFGPQFGPWQHGRYDHGQDGGDIARWDADHVWYGFTEDGGGGRQWFRRSGCPTERRGWNVWIGQPVSTWSAWNYHLGIAGSADGCPAVYQATQTRWRVQPVTFQWHDGQRSGTATLDAMVSLHIAGGPPEVAWGGEFFVMVPELGRIAWGAFFHPERHPDPHSQWVNRWWSIHTDQRCPGMEAQIMGLVPGGHVLADCRLWTHFERTPARMMEWPQ